MHAGMWERTWHRVGPEADVVHEAEHEEGDQAQNVRLVEQLKESAADILHRGGPQGASTQPADGACQHVRACTAQSCQAGQRCSVLTPHLIPANARSEAAYHADGSPCALLAVQMYVHVCTTS